MAYGKNSKFRTAKIPWLPTFRQAKVGFSYPPIIHMLLTYHDAALTPQYQGGMCKRLSTLAEMHNGHG